MGVVVSPSLLAGDFARLADTVAAVAGSADWVHVDVMDGHFVPNLTLGLPVVEALARLDLLPLDCHLMIEDPDRWAPGYAEVGAAGVTVHAEAVRDPVATARALRARGARAGLALKPATRFEDYAELLPELDMVLVMTVEPGFGGQAFLADQLAKVRAVRAALAGRDDLEVRLQVDGGIDERTAAACAEAGADTLVAGSAVYRDPEPADAVRRIRAAAEASRLSARPAG